MYFRQIFDERLAQYTYLVGCQRTGTALLIDPERDVDRYVRIADEDDLRIVAVTETHIHADFLSGSRQLAAAGVKVYLSAAGGDEWSYRWPAEGQYDVILLEDGDSFSVGNVEVRAILTPGHTPEHLSFAITDRGSGADEPMGVVTGDFVFVGDAGRPDLLESAAGVQGAMRLGAEDLYRSVQSFLELPDYLQIWPGHGAGSACGKALGAVPESTVGYERRFSPAMRAAQAGREAFVDYVLDGQPEPPLYFGRMKRLNRDGPPLLDTLPSPRRVCVGDLDGLLDRPDAVFLDARENRTGFMAGHLPGALYVPFDETFPTVAGSYVDPDWAVILVIEEEHVDEAVRNLVRVGLDRVEAFVAPSVLEHWVEQGGRLERIAEIDMVELEARRNDPDSLVLDVRRAAEFVVSHVPAAMNLSHVRLPEGLAALPRDRKLLVYCRTGSRSAAASALLKREGFDPVYVNGLFADWQLQVTEDVAGAAPA